MSYDTVDLLHDAEDRIGVAEHALSDLVNAVLAWLDRHELERLSYRELRVALVGLLGSLKDPMDNARLVLKVPYRRADCVCQGGDCDPDYCGCECHEEEP